MCVCEHVGDTRLITHTHTPSAPSIHNKPFADDHKFPHNKYTISYIFPAAAACMPSCPLSTSNCAYYASLPTHIHASERMTEPTFIPPSRITQHADGQKLITFMNNNPSLLRRMYILSAVCANSASTDDIGRASH